MAWDWDKLKEQQDRREGAGKPPQVDELFEKFKGANLSSIWLFLIACVLLAVLGFMTSFYTVAPDEKAVVQRFGRYIRTEGAGAHFRFPFGIEKKTIVSTKVESEVFEGVSTAMSASRSGYADADTGNVSLMLTGDLNVALVPWIVQYKVSDPRAFLFEVANVKETLRDLAESAMRTVVGDSSVDEVINSRQMVAAAAKALLQKDLDEAMTGLEVSQIQMQTTTVPPPVQASFNEVNQAMQEKEKLIYQAKEAYNKAIPAAEGEADRTIKKAEGYKLDRVNRAQGDASRFNSIYGEYIKAKDVTRQRMYLETIKDVLPKMGAKFIVDSDEKNLLPLLNLNPLNGKVQ